MIFTKSTVGNLTDLLALAPMFSLGSGVDGGGEPPAFEVRAQFDVAASVTIDDRGFARVVIHDPLGRVAGDRIPLWSVTEDRPIGELAVGTGIILNGHSII